MDGGKEQCMQSGRTVDTCLSARLHVEPNVHQSVPKRTRGRRSIE